jgi:hypothetical protein
LARDSHGSPLRPVQHETVDSSTVRAAAAETFCAPVSGASSPIFKAPQPVDEGQAPHKPESSGESLFFQPEALRGAEFGGITALPALWPRLAALYGNAPACREPHNPEAMDLTYASMWATMRKVAHGLCALGLRRGEILGLIAESSSRWMLADQVRCSGHAMSMTERGGETIASGGFLCWWPVTGKAATACCGSLCHN